MKNSIITFRYMEEYIVNAFDYEYSNGRTEGMNNLIKQINILLVVIENLNI